MGFFSSREFKIFLCFFIIYAYFVHWVGWGENARFDLTRAVVEEGRLEIDSFFRNTGDRAFYMGHYYEDKPPGHPFLAVPVYAAFRFFYYGMLPASFVESQKGSADYLEYGAGSYLDGC